MGIFLKLHILYPFTVYMQHNDWYVAVYSGFTPGILRAYAGSVWSDSS